MKDPQKICIIGDIVVDVSLNLESDNKLRFGGIIHPARALWATNSNYTLGFFCPQYLDERIQTFTQTIGAPVISKLGNITGAPYVFLINEVKEIGDQGYEFILRDEVKTHYIDNTLSKLNDDKITDILIISGNFELGKVLQHTSNHVNIHIDIANNVGDISYLDQLSRPLTSLFLSTSSQLFKKYFHGDFIEFSNSFRKYTNKLILKENRGGSRAVDFESEETFSIPAQTRPIVHSVGVGDVFDAIYIANYRKGSFEDSLVLASWVAAEYALTTFPDDFKMNSLRVFDTDVANLKKIGGVILHWEQRRRINIYIAAPDFDFLDTSIIDRVCDSLQYHNFTPRRPVKEVGQMEDNASIQLKAEIFSRDIEILNECQIVLAVLINLDPGTLVEIGLGVAYGKPTFVYDPKHLGKNCMLNQAPNLVSSDLDEIISEIFCVSSKI